MTDMLFSYKRFGKCILFFTIPIITLAALFFLRTVPRAQVWKSYRVVAVELPHDESYVMNTLESSGCLDIISLSTQQSVPLSPAIFAGNDFLFSYTTSIAQENSKYLSEREKYFFDKSHSYKLYYIPSSYERAAANAVSVLNKSGVVASIDSTVRFPWLSPIVCLIAFALPFYLCRRKFIFAVAAIFPILFSWSIPFYSIAAAVCLFFPVIFEACNILYRKDKYFDLFKSPVIVLLIVAFLISFVTSFVAGFLFLLCIVSSMCVLSLAEILRGKNVPVGFPTFIVPAHIMLKTGKQLRNVFLVCIADLLLLTICFFFGSRFLPSSVSANSIELPSRDAYSEHILPGLDEYTVWVWDSQTFPYKVVGDDFNADVKDGDAVIFPRYSENGTIDERKDIMFMYDKKYKEQAIDSIDALPFMAVEKLMKAEGIYTGTGYSTGGDASTDSRKTIVLLLSALFVTICVIVFYEYYYSRTANLWRKENR